MSRPDVFDSVYLDSVSLIYVLTGHSGYEPVARLLQRADSGNLSVMISPMSLVEVRGQERTAPYDNVREEAARTLVDNPRFLLIEFDRTVALKAREMVWRHGLKPADSIHLASAIVGGADVFMTYDKRFPHGQTIDGVWVDVPFEPGGPDLFGS